MSQEQKDDITAASSEKLRVSRPWSNVPHPFTGTLLHSCKNDPRRPRGEALILTPHRGLTCAVTEPVGWSYCVDGKEQRTRKLVVHEEGGGAVWLQLVRQVIFSGAVNLLSALPLPVPSPDETRGGLGAIFPGRIATVETWRESERQREKEREEREKEREERETASDDQTFSPSHFSSVSDLTRQANRTEPAACQTPSGAGIRCVTSQLEATGACMPSSSPVHGSVIFSGRIVKEPSGGPPDTGAERNKGLLNFGRENILLQAQESPPAAEDRLRDHVIHWPDAHAHREGGTCPCVVVGFLVFEGSCDRKAAFNYPESFGSGCVTRLSSPRVFEGERAAPAIEHCAWQQ
ncbi:unnamed protein product [Pleuronectes platessa]|uniref:Uncharacterized protein n=1 Tax=Pleuronectes platessa TaxID=8262 RepID=A0A9N7YRU0_PLEPL|nr:unnamed protein product [Pleuronectes platessa]